MREICQLPEAFCAESVGSIQGWLLHLGPLISHQSHLGVRRPRKHRRFWKTAALAALLALLAYLPASAPAASSLGTAGMTALPGGAMTRSNPTPFSPSRDITGARWASPRYDPPANQAGDILPTVWSDDGLTYVLMDDGGVDVPMRGGLWRQSIARVTGSPPNLRFEHVGDPSLPPPRTWGQIGGNRDSDTGPLGPYYSIGLAEADGIFYATQQRNWNWSANGEFTGLAGIAYSHDHGNTWRSTGKHFPAPLGNLSFVHGGGPGGAYPDGYVYAIGTEREFNASKMVLGRVAASNLTEPARWQWYSGGAKGRGSSWSASLGSARPVLEWGSHITYPQMSYDPPLHRYLLTFTYSYSSQPPAVWKGGAELVILEAPNPWGPFSFVARSPYFGPSNGYGAGFPSQWISTNGQDLWLKWAANFAGCSAGLECSGKYGFNVARVHLTRAQPANVVAYAAGGAIAVILAAAALAYAIRRSRRAAIKNSRPFVYHYWQPSGAVGACGRGAEGAAG